MSSLADPPKTPTGQGPQGPNLPPADYVPVTPQGNRLASVSKFHFTPFTIKTHTVAQHSGNADLLKQDAPEQMAKWQRRIIENFALLNELTLEEFLDTYLPTQKYKLPGATVTLPKRTAEKALASVPSGRSERAMYQPLVGRSSSYGLPPVLIEATHFDRSTR